jgi:hypothetical protein
MGDARMVAVAVGNSRRLRPPSVGPTGDSVAKAEHPIVCGSSSTDSLKRLSMGHHSSQLRDGFLSHWQTNATSPGASNTRAFVSKSFYGQRDR